MKKFVMGMTLSAVFTGAFLLNAETVPVTVAEKITVDGNFEDWGKIASFKDAAGDVPVADEVDFTEFKISNDDQNLYILYRSVQPILLDKRTAVYCVFIDSDNRKSTGCRGWNMKWALGADILIQGAFVYRFDGETQREWKWKQIGACTHSRGLSDDKAVELSIPLNTVGLKKGMRISCMLYGDNTNEKDFFPDKNIKPIEYVLK